MNSVHFQGKPFSVMIIQVYAQTSNAEESEVEWFYEDLQDLLELTPPKDVLFIIGGWNATVGGQETPGVTCKFELGVQTCALPISLTSNAEEAEVEWFYEDLQDLLELTPPKDVLFIIEDWKDRKSVV